jgi:hypothetical protein
MHFLESEFALVESSFTTRIFSDLRISFHKANGKILENITPIRLLRSQFLDTSGIPQECVKMIVTKKLQ